MVPKDLRYTDKHEWVRLDGDLVTVGITDHAQQQLGAVVGVGLPQEGSAVERHGALADLDSMKTAEQVFAPVSGTVVKVNRSLESHPELMNEDPYGEGWVAVIRMADPGQLQGLMTADQYEAFLAEEAARG